MFSQSQTYKCEKCGFETFSVSGWVPILKGRKARPGCVKGIVRILPNPAQIDEFQEGEILVTSQTCPESVPAMEKAAGVITDTGGILCHAANLSRELGKPCIVGTQDATEKLQNGMSVVLCGCAGVVMAEAVDVA